MADKKICSNCGQPEGKHAAYDNACPIVGSDTLFRKDLFFRPAEESAPVETIVHSVCQDCFKCERLRYDGFPCPIYKCDGKPSVPSAAIKAFTRCPFPEWRVEKKDKYRKVFDAFILSPEFTGDSKYEEGFNRFLMICRSEGLE
ncbi:MAG: hypothetical protein UX91_C0015G0009 [Candidatus Amesbacteria bacterium GW2011_GWB1_47_19]|nr:MAG: hypothetical protein UX91_C0015G0009 [Candidatus Amesbacteria bacterium GW2011_GWB1_47_19]